MLIFLSFMFRVVVMSLLIGRSLDFVYTTIVDAIPSSTQPPADSGDDDTNGEDMDDGGANGMDDDEDPGAGNGDTDEEPAACVEGESCDDGDPCTRNDLCIDGVCQGAPVIDCVLCETSADCDQGDNPCATGSCVQGACLIQNQVGPCDDGDPCTESDVCMNGECVGTAIPGCSDDETQEALTIVIRGDGSVIEDPANADQPGQTVTLTAIAFGCAVFDHWEGGLDGADNPAMIVLDENAQVTAVFALDASANLAGEWVIMREVLSTSGDPGCSLPTVGAEDAVDAGIMSSQGVVTLSIDPGDLDGDGFADALPGGLFPIDGCPGDDAFEMVVELDASTGLIEAKAEIDTIERCGCSYQSQVEFDVVFESCEVVEGIQEWTIRQECAGEDAVECEVRYGITVVPAGL